MLCCAVAGLLLAVVRRSARRSRTHRPLLALLFGFGVGALVVELVVTGLSALGAATASGPVIGQVAVLVLPAAITATAGSMGAAGSLMTPSGIMMTTVAAVVGSLTAENLDVHVLALHVPVGALATFAVHAPTMVLLAGGLWWRSLVAEAADAAGLVRATAGQRVV